MNPRYRWILVAAFLVGFLAGCLNEVEVNKILRCQRDLAAAKSAADSLKVLRGFDSMCYDWIARERY